MQLLWGLGGSLAVPAAAWLLSTNAGIQFLFGPLIPEPEEGARRGLR